MSNSRRLRRRPTEVRNATPPSGLLATWARLRRWLGLGY